MTFESFIKGDVYPFREEESLEEVKSKLVNGMVHSINERDQAYAIHAQGAEFLFEMNQLWLIQYELGQVDAFVFENKIVDKDTSYNDFIALLTKSNISFKKENKNQQKILITFEGVKIFFGEKDNKFQAAIKSWY